MKPVQDTCEQAVLTPINESVTRLPSINRNHKLFQGHYYTKKKEKQQILEIQSFPLSGMGEEQVCCMEFKHSSLLGSPPVFGASTPKIGDSHSTLQQRALISLSVPA